MEAGQEKSPEAATLGSQNRTRKTTEESFSQSAGLVNGHDKEPRATETLTAALYYYDHGCFVVPCCTMNEQGECPFPHTHDSEKSIGKMPILGKDWPNARLTREEILWWCTKYPTANVGVLLEPSKLLVVDVDSKEAELEAARRGLPPGPQVKTGGGVHHYYRNPKGIVGATTRQGDSGKIDILSQGIVIAHGSRHRSGVLYEQLVSFEEWELEEPPQWAEEWLLASKKAQAKVEALPDDLPSVNLDSLQIPRWLHDIILHGQPKHHEKYPSRSEAVWAVVTSLVQAGHDTATIASILLDPRFKISEKPRAQGPRWLAGEIGRARAKTATSNSADFVNKVREDEAVARAVLYRTRRTA